MKNILVKEEDIWRKKVNFWSKITKFQTDLLPEAKERAEITRNLLSLWI